MKWILFILFLLSSKLFALGFSEVAYPELGTSARVLAMGNA